MDTERFKKLPKAQRHAAWRLYKRRPDGSRTFADFVARLEPEILGDAVMVHWQGIVIGIEPDGYTHS